MKKGNSYISHRQLSMDIKMKNYKFRTSFVKKTCNIFFILTFVENYLQRFDVHDFSVWLRTGSNMEPNSKS